MRNKYDEPIPRTRIRDLIDAAVQGSYSNADGTGAFNREGAVFVSEKPLHDIERQKLVDHLEGSKEIVIHLRMGTTGSTCTENAHPFEHEGMTMAHNGVIRRTETSLDDSTDSEEFLHDIAAAEEENVPEKIVEAAENVTGSMSIFLRSHEEEATYYFRDTSRFTFGHTAEEVVGATAKQRLDYLDRTRNESHYSVSNTWKPESGVVYRLEEGFSPYVYAEEMEEFEVGKNVDYRGGGLYGGYSSTYGGRYRGKIRNKSTKRVRTGSSNRDNSDDGSRRFESNREMEGMTYAEYKQKRIPRDEREDWDDGYEYPDMPSEW